MTAVERAADEVRKGQEKILAGALEAGAPPEAIEEIVAFFKAAGGLSGVLMELTKLENGIGDRLAQVVYYAYRLSLNLDMLDHFAKTVQLYMMLEEQQVTPAELEACLTEGIRTPRNMH